ncbi:MAG: HigA family addiction module antitoxin [Hyphomicrobium sp.]
MAPLDFATDPHAADIFKDHDLDDDKAPLHPGDVLREDYLPHMALTPATLAAQLGVSVSAVADLLAERASVSPDMALRLADVVGPSQHYWLALQAQFDLWHYHRDREADLTAAAVARRRSPSVVKAAPAHIGL